MSRSQRAAIVIPSLSGGGAERAALNLAASTSMVEVVVIAESGEGELAADPLAAQVMIGAERARGRASRVRRLVSMLRIVAPDLVVSTLSPVVVTAAATLRGVPVMHWVQNPLSPPRVRVPGGGDGHRLRPLLRPVARRARLVALASPGWATEWQSLGVPPSLIGLLPNPILLGRHEPSHPRPGWREPLRLISVGRLVPQKRHDLLLEAVAALRGRGRRAELRLVGEGLLMELLRQQAIDLGIGEHVSFEGFVHNPTELMAEADLFVLASDYEGFGNVLVEALAVGTPIVATDCPHGPRFILDHGRFGQLVMPGSADALAEAIEARVAQGPPRKSDIERSRCRAADFAGPRVAARFTQMVEAILDDELGGAPFVSW